MRQIIAELTNTLEAELLNTSEIFPYKHMQRDGMKPNKLPKISFFMKTDSGNSRLPKDTRSFSTCPVTVCCVTEDKIVISAPSCLPDTASAVKRRADATEEGDNWS